MTQNKDFSKFKWRVCKAGEAVNPILLSSGEEIEVEQFGIVGYLWKVKNKTKGHKDEYFYQCPLVDSKEPGTGKFREWLRNVKKFVREEFDSSFAMCNITNQKLYKHFMEEDISVAVKDVLFKIQMK